MTAQGRTFVGGMRRVGVKKRHSKAFHATVILAVLMMWTFYIPVIVPDADNLGIVPYALLFLLPKLFVLLYFVCGVIGSREFKKSYLYYALSLLVVIAISVFLTRSGVERALSLCLFISIVMFYSYHRFRENEMRAVIVLCCFCVAAVMINSNNDFYSLPNGFNPNTTGFLLALLYCVFFTMAMGRKKAIYWFITLVCLALQFVYVSRTALLGVALYTALYIVFRARKKTFKRKTVFAAIFILSVLGVVFAYLYSVTLFDMIGHGNVFILGKDLFTGRQVIWAGAFESLKQEFWFGVGSHLNESMYEAGAYAAIMDAHNQPLGILAYCGIFVFVVYYLFLSRVVSAQYKHADVDRAPALFFAVITVMSYFEAYFLSQYCFLFIGIVFAAITAISRRPSAQGVAKCI